MQTHPSKLSRTSGIRLGQPDKGAEKNRYATHRIPTRTHYPTHLSGSSIDQYASKARRQYTRIDITRAKEPLDDDDQAPSRDPVLIPSRGHAPFPINHCTRIGMSLPTIESARETRPPQAHSCWNQRAGAKALLNITLDVQGRADCVYQDALVGDVCGIRIVFFLRPLFPFSSP